MSGESEQKAPRDVAIVAAESEVLVAIDRLVNERRRWEVLNSVFDPKQGSDVPRSVMSYQATRLATAMQRVEEANSLLAEAKLAAASTTT